MASYSVDVSKHATSGTATVDTVTLEGGNGPALVVNRNGADALYFTINGNAPTVGGDNTYVIPGIGSFFVPSTVGAAQIKIITAVPVDYSVIAL